jgi:hypothetical protein
MKKISVFYLISGFALFAAPMYLFKGAIACELAVPLGYKETLANVFIAKDTHDTVKDLSYLKDAAKRVSDTFGETIATPTLILTADKSASSTFFASETAASHFSPFSNCLVIGPKGQNIDVVAHELVHAEIYARLGWLTQVLKMPRWFEEGVALTVDLREPFLPENISLSGHELEAVKSLFYGHQFYNENAFNNYRAARLAAEPVNKREFYANLERMRQGESFNNVFGL